MNEGYLNMQIPQGMETELSLKFKGCPEGMSFLVEDNAISNVRGTCAYWSKKLGRKFRCKALQGGTIQVWREAAQAAQPAQAAPVGADPVADQAHEAGMTKAEYVTRERYAAETAAYGVGREPGSCKLCGMFHPEGWPC